MRRSSVARIGAGSNEYSTVQILSEPNTEAVMRGSSKVTLAETELLGTGSTGLERGYAEIASPRGMKPANPTINAMITTQRLRFSKTNASFRGLKLWLFKRPLSFSPLSIHSRSFEPSPVSNRAYVSFSLSLAQSPFLQLWSTCTAFACLNRLISISRYFNIPIACYLLIAISSWQLQQSLDKSKEKKSA